LAMANPRMLLHSLADKIQDATKQVPGVRAVLIRLRDFADQLDTEEALHFAGEKMDSKYYWWDSLVLLRKILLVTAGSLAVTMNNSSGSCLTWFMGTFVTIFALVLHSIARPFYDAAVDRSEFLGLITMLLLFQSGIVFKLLNDPQDPRNNPANFDASLDGYIQREEYESLLCKDSFDYDQPKWDSLSIEGRETGSIELGAFSEWWLAEHSRVGKMLSNLTLFFVFLSLFYGVYAEFVILVAVRSRAKDGGIKSINKRFREQLDDMQDEFTRHMTDIYNTAKGSVALDDDLDVYSQAVAGIMEQEELLSKHTKTMKRIAIQTFLEIAQDEDEAADWVGTMNRYETAPDDPNQVETAHSRVEREDRNKLIRQDWEYWEHEAFERRLLKFDEEWISKPGGFFQQGFGEDQPLLNFNAVEEQVVASLSTLEGKDGLLDNMLQYHTSKIEAGVNVDKHTARLQKLKEVRSKYSTRKHTRKTAGTTEEANPLGLVDSDEEDMDNAGVHIEGAIKDSANREDVEERLET